MRISGHFRRFLSISSLVLAACLGLVRPVAAQAIAVTDVRGRTVQVPRQASKLLIDDGRFLVALALIHPDPVSVVGAWPRDINRIGDDVYQRLKAKNPAIEKLPQVASSAGTFSLEGVLAAKP